MVVAVALRAGQHRVVVRQDGRRPAVDGADARHQAVGRGAGDEVLERAPATLRGHHEGPVLDERALVEEVGDVLAGGAVPAGVAAGHGLVTSGVEAAGVAVRDLGEIGARTGGGPVRNRRPRPVRGRGDGGAPVRPSGRSLCGRLRHDRQDVPGLDGVARGHPHLGQRAVGAGVDGVLHLHRLDDHHGGAGVDGRADRDLDAGHGPGQRGQDVSHAVSL